MTVSEVFLEKRDRSDASVGFFQGDPGTRFGYRVGFRPAGAVSVVWEMEFTYEPDGLGGYRQRRTMNLQTAFGL